MGEVHVEDNDHADLTTIPRHTHSLAQPFGVLGDAGSRSPAKAAGNTAKVLSRQIAKLSKTNLTGAAKGVVVHVQGWSEIPAIVVVTGRVTAGRIGRSGAGVEVYADTVHVIGATGGGNAGHVAIVGPGVGAVVKTSGSRRAADDHHIG